MKLDSKKYLSDIEYSIILIEDFITGFSFIQYQKDLKTKSAVERQLGIIGEAVNNYRKSENKELTHSKEMNDTSKEILQKQFEIIMGKPLKDRLNVLFEMTDLSRKIIQNRIIAGNPKISEVDLKIETFKTFYRRDFDDNSLNQIAVSMRQYWNNKQS